MGSPRFWQAFAAVTFLATAAGAETLPGSKWERFSEISPNGAISYHYDLKSDYSDAALIVRCWPAEHNIRIFLTIPALKGARREGFITFNRPEGGISQTKTMIEAGSVEASEFFGALVMRDMPGTVFVAVENERFHIEPLGSATVNADAVKRCHL